MNLRLICLLMLPGFGPGVTGHGADREQAADSKPPYPPSPVIAEIEWAPVETIIRKAKDGDNWPLTWADDDALYTTWGDGTGFVPKVEKKLSMGFARVTGAPDDFSGVNIRSAAEQLGQGRAGKKGWGLLCVDGVLYLWLGHADNQGATAQLAWSRDHAKIVDVRRLEAFAEFGMMGFVNFGKNYAGARDDFVYAYSHDDPRADTPADRFILLRAPKDKLTSRDVVGVLHEARCRRPAGLDARHPAARRGLRKPRRVPALGHDVLRAAEALPLVAAPPAAARRHQRPRRHALHRRLRHLRRTGTVGPVDDGVLHREMGRRPRRARRFPREMDERRRQDAAPRLLRRG